MTDEGKPQATLNDTLDTLHDSVAKQLLIKVDEGDARAIQQAIDLLKLNKKEVEKPKKKPKSRMTPGGDPTDILDFSDEADLAGLPSMSGRNR